MAQESIPKTASILYTFRLVYHSYLFPERQSKRLIFFATYLTTLSHLMRFLGYVTLLLMTISISFVFQKIIRNSQSPLCGPCKSRNRTFYPAKKDGMECLLSFLIVSLDQDLDSIPRASETLYYCY